MRHHRDRGLVPILAVAGLSALAACSSPHRSADQLSASGSTVRPALAAAPAAPDRPDQPLDTTLTARRGGVVATINDWQLRYEGTISDGRPRFLESVSNGQQKDVVFDPTRSRAYPFADVAIEIIRSTPDLLVYRIRAAD